MSRHLATVQGNQVELRSESANCDLLTFPTRPVDRNARYTLQRLREIRVRELADILGGDRLDHTPRITLDIRRLHQAAANTRNDDFLDDVVLGDRGRCQRST
jgi:hypothetical protein